MTEDNWTMVWIVLVTLVFPVTAMVTISEGAGAFVFVLGVGGSIAAAAIKDRIDWRYRRLVWEHEHRNDGGPL